MKKLLVLSLLITTAPALPAQNPTAAIPVGVPPTPPLSLAPPPVVEAPPARPRDPGFTRFNINFRGGPPALLVERITNETRKPLNVIIPPEQAATELPPLHLNGVTVPQLFDALGQASRKSVTYYTGSGLPNVYQQFQRGTSGFGFKTAEPKSEDSIWHFFVDDAGEPPKPPAPPEKATVCRFFQLSPYLERGLKVEDITTALEAAWKMLGENTAAKIKFHQDTNLLIAVGHADKLMLIDDVLTQLQNGPVGIDPATGLPLAPPAASRGSKSPENNLPKPVKP